MILLVNNIDIVNFKAKLLKKDIQTAEVTIYDDWLRNALNPLYLGRIENYKKIKIQLYIKNINDEISLGNISDLIKQFEKCTIKFDDLSFYYDCVIVNKSHEKILKSWYTIDIELKSSYAYKPSVTETMNHVASKSINVLGNTPSPAIVTITAPVDTISITLAGFGDDPITINNLKANTPVIVDGESCLVTQSGVNKYIDTNMWEFPVLQPGVNAIGASSANCVISISYKPKFI